MRIILGSIILLVALLMGYSASYYKAPDIEADIQARTEARLAEAEVAGDLLVETDGRDVTLRGYAGSEAEKARILEDAETVWGALGPIDAIKLLEVVEPYALSMIKEEGGKPVLLGVAPSDAARTALIGRAKEVLGDGLVSDVTLAAGVPDGDWVGAVSRGMEGLSVLDHGELRVIDKAMTLTGQASGSAEAARIDTLKGEVDPAFTLASDLDLARPLVTPFTFEASKTADGFVIQGHAPDDETRSMLLSRLKEKAGDSEVLASIVLADGMPDEAWPARAAAALDALAVLETGSLSISDRDVQLQGDVRNQADLEALQVMRADLPEGEAWQSDLVLLRPTVRPYLVEIEKKAGGAWSVTGAVPDEASRDALIQAVGAVAEGREVDAKLQLADGMPGVDWPAFVEDRLAALHGVDHGSLRFEDYDVRLEGQVATMDEAERADDQIAGLDPKIQTQFEVLDPTVEAFVDLRLSPDDGVTANGALPPGLSREEAVELLGLQAGFEGEFIENGRGDAAAWRQDLGAIGSYLPEFETVDISLRNGLAAIEGETHAKSDAEQVIDKLAEALDQRWRPEIAIEPTGQTYAEGRRRTNPLSGGDEEYRRGFWLPVTTIEAGLDACRAETSLILASNKITFLVGEARLDARARGIINDLSSVAIGCLDKTGDRRLEIGGHTDSQGADEMNLKLSQARAEAVLRALIARGVEESALTARGYGETTPIADNAEREGRAANRRITFEWLGEHQG